MEIDDDSAGRSPNVHSKLYSKRTKKGKQKSLKVEQGVAKERSYEALEDSVIRNE